MSEHEKADDLERELDDLQQRSDSLHEEIESAEDEWESKKRDEHVPGATGELDEQADDGGGDDVSPEDLDFGRDVDKQDIVGEAPAPSGDEEEDG